MILAILLLVSFLVLMQVLGMIGFTNTRARNQAAKRIARELYELQQEDERSQYRSLEDERWHS